MGCVSAKDVDCRARLEVVRQSIAAQSGKEGDVGLAEIAKSAQEMKDVMQVLIDTGGKDLKGMQKAESLSDDVLENLGARVNPELLQRSDFEKIKTQLLAIAKDLDAVRATPATSVVEGYIKNAQDKIMADGEKRAKVHMDHLVAAGEGLKDKKNLVPKSNEILDLIEKAHEEAPTSRTVTDFLLKRVMSLSSIILKLKASWLTGIDSIKEVQTTAERLDAVAKKLVAVMETTWEPPMAPQIQHEVKSFVTQLSRQLLATAQKELNSANVGGTFDALDEFRPWWPLAQEVDGVSMELVGLFSKVHTCASQEFISASKDGDEDTAAAIRDFAKKFDALRPTFEGLPPPSETEKRGLVATLDFSEAKATVEKQLSRLDGEYGKATDGDKSTQLSLAITVQALEELVPVWATVVQADASFGERLQTTCGNIEAWAIQAAAVCGAKKADGLLKFAENYDDRRRRLTPPEPAAGALKARIAERTADVHLKAAEAELAKERGLNVMSLLESFKSAVASFKVDAASMPSVQERLSAAFDKTAERVVKTHSEALAAGERRKEETLQRFATDFDEVWNSFKEAAKIEDKAGLTVRLAGEREKLAMELLAAIQAALPATGKADLAALLTALTALEPVLPKLPEISPVPEQLKSALQPLEDRIDESCKNMSTAGDTSEADVLLSQTGQLDAILPSMVPSLLEDHLKPRVVGAVVQAHISNMDTEVFSKQINCASLSKELEAVRPLMNEDGCSDASRKHIMDFISVLDTHLIASAAVTGGEAELRVAAVADETAAVAASATPSAKSKAKEGVRKRVEGAMGASRTLAEMREELAKPAGMNPTVVVQGLQRLEPLWEPVKDVEAFKQRLVEALNQFHQKLDEAGRKALQNEKKMKALMAFAEDADAKQQKFVPLSPGLEIESYCESLSRMVADEHLKAIEAELSKESGMNSEQILKRMTELAGTWPKIGKADSGPAAKEAIPGLETRVQEVSNKVQSRMVASLKDALSAENKKKETALMSFAKEFDNACGTLRGTVLSSDAGLLSCLEAEAGAAGKE